MSEVARSIRIVERDGEICRIVGTGPRGPIEVICGLSLEGRRLILHGLHADGEGPGSLGLTEVRAYARLLARQFGATVLEVRGAQRSTGAKPGKLPRSVVIRVEE